MNDAKLTASEIAKLPVKWVTIKQFTKMMHRFSSGDIDIEATVKRLENKMHHGEFLGVHMFLDKAFRLHLKKIWTKEFTLSYSVHKNTKSGKELLISNMPLPPGPVVTKKRK